MCELLQNVVNIAYAIILQRQNTCDNGIANTCFGDIDDLLKYCPTLPQIGIRALQVNSLSPISLIQKIHAGKQFIIH